MATNAPSLVEKSNKNRFSSVWPLGISKQSVFFIEWSTYFVLRYQLLSSIRNLGATASTWLCVFFIRIFSPVASLFEIPKFVFATTSCYCNNTTYFYCCCYNIVAYWLHFWNCFKLGSRKSPLIVRDTLHALNTAATGHFTRPGSPFLSPFPSVRLKNYFDILLVYL